MLHWKEIPENQLLLFELLENLRPNKFIFFHGQPIQIQEFFENLLNNLFQMQSQKQPREIIEVSPFQRLVVVSMDV